ncbi:MAG: Methyltransferase type 11 [Verrucomicrobiales bacterium]|nr:Methyltransferase type 11 [Verrucomicrobiales bacterium]
MRRLFDPDNPELMDRPQPVSPALERDLANLRGLNRWFGAWRIVRRVLGPVLTQGGRVEIADLCCGSGDLPRLMVQLGRRHGTRVEVEAVEGHPATFEIGRGFCADTPEVRFVHADVRTWEPAGKPDWVVCSLALHHFRESDAMDILKRMRTAASRGVLVADLERAWWASAGIHAASLFYREPMTVEDMRRSAKAAFSRRELRDLTLAAGWGGIRQERFWYGRQAVWEVF